MVSCTQNLELQNAVFSIPQLYGFYWNVKPYNITLHVATSQSPRSIPHVFVCMHGTTHQWCHAQIECCFYSITQLRVLLKWEALFTSYTYIVAHSFSPAVSWRGVKVMSMSHSSEPLAGREVSSMHKVPLTKSDSVTVMVPGEKVAIATVCVHVCVWRGTAIT